MRDLSFKNDKGLLALLSIAGALIIVFSANKYWAPFDEGIVTVAAQRLLSGEVLYKDIFLVMYPPGQPFLLALIYKISGVSIEAGRLLAAFTQLVLLLSFMFTVYALIKNRLITFLTWLAGLSCLAPRMGTIPAPIWTGVALSMCAIFLFTRYALNGNSRALIGTGLLAGAAIIFRHDIGIFLAGALFIGIMVSRRGVDKLIKFIFVYSVIPCLVLLYFAKIGALKDMVDSLVLFPFVHEKTACLPFPKPCLDLNMIFHGSLQFISINQYYIPLLAYAGAVLFLIYRYFVVKRYGYKEHTVLVLFLFGIASFNQVRIRPDPAHLLTVVFPAMAVLAFMADALLKDKNIKGFLKFSLGGIVIVNIFLATLLIVKNADKSFKNTIRKPLKGSSVYFRIENGGFYIPKEEKDEVAGVVNFIRKNTSEGERVYIGNISHDVDTFGGSTLLYTLFDRMPSTKYYELLPGLVTRADVQEEIKDSLEKFNVRYIVLQDIVLPEGKGVSKGPLDVYIALNYTPGPKYGKYNIYEKNSVP